MRKYRFTSREAAEQAEAQAARDRDNLSVALNAALEGRIAWLPAIPGETANSPYYCFGVIHRKYKGEHAEARRQSILAAIRTAKGQ